MGLVSSINVLIRFLLWYAQYPVVLIIFQMTAVVAKPGQRVDIEVPGMRFRQQWHPLKNYF